MITPAREQMDDHFDKAARFVVLKLESISLIIVQQEIEALEPVLDVQPHAVTATDVSKPSEVSKAEVSKANAAGRLSLANGDCPVYALNSSLKCVAAIPLPHRICAIMRHREQRYALSCTEVQLLPRGALAIHDVPKSLLSLQSPVKLLIVNDGQLLLGTTAAALYVHVTGRMDAEIIQFDERVRRMRT